MNELNDMSRMPFGKFTGKPMGQVPADYLHFLWTHGMKDDKQSNVADYIRRNLSALKKELPDAIWT